MPDYNGIPVPADGERITVDGGKFKIPDHPIIPFIEGDGIGRDIWKASVRVFDAAVEKTFGDSKKIAWYEILAGEKAFDKTGEWLPEDTLGAIREFHVAIKGPLTTPVGGGIRSLNVALRQILTLYSCVRPCRWYTGVPSPVKEPEKVNVVLFRENTEDIYAGIEWEQGTAEVAKVINFLNDEMGRQVRPDSGIGIKPISITGSKRLIRAAINYAIEHGRKKVTLVHKGNIQKFTEGAFRDWGYELAREEYPDQLISEDEVWEKHDGKVPDGKIMINDRIADSMFQQILLRPSEYDVVATTNLNGDYLSDACAAQIGGLGMAPGANIGDDHALFEATHGTAPKYADKGVINPSSVMLSGVMMFQFMGWKEVADRIERGIEGAISAKTVTYDLHRQMEGATKVGTAEFADAIISHMD